MFLTGPKVVEAALGEQVSMEDLGGPARARAQRRLPARRRRRPRRGRLARELLGAAAPSRSASQPPIAPGRRRRARRRTTRRRPCRTSRARSTTSATSLGAIADRGSLLELSRRLGAQHGHGARPYRRPPGRRRRQPAAVPRRRDRRRRGREGGALRRRLRPLRAAAGGPCRHPRVHARHAARRGRRDPPRRLAAARVRRPLGCRS